MCEFLNAPSYDFNDLDKEFDLDEVATEICGTKFVWPKNSALKVSNVMLLYYELHKIATNWWPTVHYSTIVSNFVSSLYDIGIGIKVDLGQVIFDCKAARLNGKMKNQSCLFPL